MSDDLIKRSDAIKALYKYSFVSKDVIEREINALPTADRPQGKWIRERWANQYLVGVECSNCHIVESRFSPFCPNCGAEMRGADDE